MRERPILFSGPMVRAILAGTKTQTRRPAPITALNFHQHDTGLLTWDIHFSKPVKGVLSSYSGCTVSEEQARNILGSWYCPYGQPGDRLWVRETWFKSDKRGMMPIYRADGDSLCAWRPSIHMPRWACRLVLEIVSVRVERLQEVGPLGAYAEGFDTMPAQERKSFGEVGYFGSRRANYAIRELRRTWDCLYAAKGQGWEANPWVWVVEFKRAEASA